MRRAASGVLAWLVCVGARPSSRPSGRGDWPVAAEASDRNWLLFQQHGRLLAVFSIEPHSVLHVGRGGVCAEAHRTSNGQLARRFGDVAIHGGANPLRVSTSARHHYYVGIFHTKDERLQYDNYAYTFASEPPR